MYSKVLTWGVGLPVLCHSFLTLHAFISAIGFIYLFHINVHGQHDEGSQPSRSWLFYVLYHKQLNLFQFLEDFSPLIRVASSVLTTWRGVWYGCICASRDFCLFSFMLVVLNFAAFQTICTNPLGAWQCSWISFCGLPTDSAADFRNRVILLT